MMELAKHAGWWWPFAGAVVVTEKPCALVRDENKRLHNEHGPALAYPDGWSIYAWHGYRVPAALIEEKDKITPASIAAERNAELRRVMFEIYTPQRFIAETGAKLLSEDINLGQPRKLYEANVGGDPVRVLHVINHSLEPDGTRREFWLGMPNEVATPHEALAMSFGFRPDVYKEAVAS